MTSESVDRRHMLAACRLAERGHGGAEPNPLVGCVIVASDGAVVGRGYHAQCGEAHAEVRAIQAAGARARGSTAYVTLEPCAHHGRTGPCTEALRAADIAEVVYGSGDPNPVAAGGAGALRSMGVAVRQCVLPEVRLLNEPFEHRIRTGLPWVCSKWACTLDGRITTGEGGPRWITGERSRRLVHRERGRVDAMLTGIGTVIGDDPDLRPRGVRAKRVPRRVIIDTRLELPLECTLVRSAHEAPVEAWAFKHAHDSRADHAAALRERGVSVRVAPQDAQGRLVMEPMLRTLAQEGVSTVLVEAGGGLNGELLNEGLINEVWHFAAGLIVGDGRGIGPVRGLQSVGGALPKAHCCDMRRVDEDIVTRWRLR